MMDDLCQRPIEHSPLDDDSIGVRHLVQTIRDLRERHVFCEKQYVWTREFLKNPRHRAAIDELAQILLEKRCLSGEEAARIIGEALGAPGGDDALETGAT